MSEVKYSKEHEWIKLDGDVATIGITKHATEMLGDIVFAELPEKGSNVEKDGTAGVVESTNCLVGSEMCIRDSHRSVYITSCFS